MIASQLPDSSWFGPLEPERANRPPQQNPALARLWRSFMTGRAVVAVLLLLLQAGIYLLGAGGGRAPLVLCVGYLAATLLVRLFARPRAPGRNFDRQWVYTIGVDVAVFSALQLYQQVSALNYTPLFAPAVLGSLLLALGTAAGVTLILLGAAWHHALLAPAAATSEFLQQGLTGMALFIVALITHQLAARLVREEVRARRCGCSAVAARRGTRRSRSTPTRPGMAWRIWRGSPSCSAATSSPIWRSSTPATTAAGCARAPGSRRATMASCRSEERRVGKECRSR